MAKGTPFSFLQNGTDLKKKARRAEFLKVCSRNCFVISTTWNATANPPYGFAPSSEVTETKQ